MTPRELAWSALPRWAQAYVALVILAGVPGVIAYFPRVYPHPATFAALLAAACVTSSWKVTLPISLASGSTLSVSYAANLTALLLLGPEQAMLIAVTGVWTQCTIDAREPYPLYRTIFSTAAEAITMIATAFVYASLGGTQGPFEMTTLARPLVGAIATYFLVNTGLVAGAIAISSRQSFARVWHDDFLWSAVSFVVAGSAGAAAAVVMQRGRHWQAILLIAPVYLTYRTYRLFVGRLEDQRELRRDKERLATALTNMKHLEWIRNELLGREQAARASAEQANRLKDEFLAMVSHELRTPLNAILGWADMLRSGSLDEARRARAMQAIHESAKRQAQLIEELLDVARIMSGKLRLEQSTINLVEIVRAAVEVVQPAADAKRIVIAVDAGATDGMLFGDAARLQQVVWNLLTNAVKFTPEEGVLNVRLRRTHDALALTVTDSGQGIEPAFLPSVFEPFRQADGSTTRRHGGLGLGLSIVKQLVEAHGGTIQAYSAGEGRGATFTVRLPLAAVFAESSAPVDRDATSSGAQAEAARASLEGISVLVVDDDDGSREVVAAYLEDHRAAVVTAASAEEALTLLEQRRVDVLLADIAMPDQDGYELVRRIRASIAPAIASIPAAALTAFAREEDRQHALRAGFQMHLTKPVDARSLIQAVATLATCSQP